MHGRTQRLARHLGELLRPETVGDAELLARFIADRDEAAFAVLVRRHGPMVAGVCRRVLHDPHAADDAFQATFLVLARRAGSLRRKSLLANWLYGVAYRTALEARRAGAIRRAKETRAAAMKEWTVEPAEQPELPDALDRELAALPEAYRTAIVLCDLEGLSRTEAATRLGWTEGTLSGRLSRARALLARRLAKYGLSVAGLAAADTLAPALVDSTAKAAVLTVIGHSVAGVVPTAAVELSQGVLKAMYVTKLKGLVAVVMVAGAVAWSGAAGQLPEAAAGPQGQAKTAKPGNPEQDRIAQLERERDELRKQLVELQDRLARMEKEQNRLRDEAQNARAEFQAALKQELARRDALAVPRVIENRIPLPDQEIPSPLPRLQDASIPPIAVPAQQPSLPPPMQSNDIPPVQPSRASAPVQPVQRSASVPVQPLPTMTPAPQPQAPNVIQVYPVEDFIVDEREAEPVTRLLTMMIEPNSWVERGGEGMVVYFSAKKLLVVRQTTDGHKKVTELLGLLRSKSPAQPQPRMVIQ